MALDVGERRIGVALSDPLGMLASPLTTIARKDEDSDIDEVLRLASENEVREIIVGLPLLLSGRHGPQAARVRAFARMLAQRSGLTVRSIDERLSSVQAERMIREAGGKPSRNKATVDAVAAAILLQAYLDSRR